MSSPVPARPGSRTATAATAARRAAAAIGVGAVAAPIGWMVYSAIGLSHDVPLPPALEGDRRVFRSPRAGRLSYYASERGSGRPVVLLHGVNAAASAAEMRPIFERLAGRRPVYALDLPGFGFSERGDREYTPELYAAAITDFLATELGEEGACDVVALSLAGELAARAALERPALVASLALLSPTGFAGRSRGPHRSGATAGGALGRLLSARPLAQPVFDALTSRRFIRHFLRKSFVGPVDERLADQAWASAHQPGARFAPLRFLGGGLFTADARARLYDRVAQPALVLYDTDPYTSFEELPATVARLPNWRAFRIAGTRGLPHFDRPEETMRALEVFWLAAAAAPVAGRAATRAGGDD